MTIELQREDRASGGASHPAAVGRQDFPPGTHLVVWRRGYLHHGIYAGDGRVVHYAGLSNSLQRGPVEEIPLEQFAAGRSILIKPARNAAYTGLEIVARARSRLGENAYRLISNNCEHFCEWCVVGAARSEQIDGLFALPLLEAMRRLLSFVRRHVRAHVDGLSGTRAA